jgi:hypothetical protein
MQFVVTKVLVKALIVKWSVSMNRLITIALCFILLVILSNRFSWFVPEVAVAATCSESGPFESGKEKVHLLELYTSEGCSSCPPAEKWLNSLYKNPELYKSFVPMAFHVDYWNYLGHKDPLSSQNYSQRQRRYAAEWKSQRVYTPGFIKNGSEWRSLIRKVPSSKGKAVGNLKIKPLSNSEFEVEFSGEGAHSVYGAFLIHGVENKIKRGENRGEILKHNFVVANLTQGTLENGKATIKLTNALKVPHKDQSVAIWVTPKESLAPIQVAARCLK